ncbi:OadG family protein [candidate division KSB1 bacterium]|nr:OadG family protein [candidate division KSB1 bacterium]
MEQGITIAVLGVSIVFASLAGLYLCVKIFVRIIEFMKFGNVRKSENVTQADMMISGEVVAAITLALQLSREELHDMEKTILTMQRITRPYSPWSSKVYGIRKPAR